MNKAQGFKEPLINNHKKSLFKDSKRNLACQKENKISLNVRSSQNRISGNLQSQSYIYPVSCLSELLFSWTVHLLKSANRTQLKTIHLGKFREDYSANTFLKEIKPHWENKKASTNSNPLIKALLAANVSPLIFIVFLSIFVSGLNILRMILFRQVLLHFEKEEGLQPYWSLLNTSLIMLTAKLLEIVLMRFFEFYTAKIGAKTTIQVNTLLYDKLLKISSFAQFSEGELINFIQIDAEKFADFFSYTPGTLVLPFQIAFYIYLLFQYFGPSFLLGMVVLIVILIVSSCIESKRIKYQKDILKLKDRRIKTTSQAFETIKVVKLYSWEDYYINKIKEERNNELEVLRKIQMIAMIINGIFWSTGTIVSLVSIIAFNIFDSHMEISNILTSIYIFNCLGEPLFLFPEYITGLFDSFVSLHRIEGFLKAKEFNKDQIDKSGNDYQYAIKINGLDFGIIKKETKKSSKVKEITIPLLKNITFKAEYGELIGITGDVGSGKTCLLNAILNNLDIINNTKEKIIVNGSIAYVSQTPWILNDTLQNNILFFKEMDENKYDYIVELCQLKQDFALLHRGDFTEIGDKGVNLSGGQKARIAIARALYSNSDIYLFDDPLSALDAYVGMSIFNRVIKEYLKGKTVIIVTHALQYIPLMTHICHMKDGKIDWFGSSEEAIQKDFYTKFCTNHLAAQQKEKNSSEPLKELCDTEVETKHKPTITEYNKPKRKNVRKLTNTEEVMGEKTESRFKIYSKLLAYTGGLFFLILFILINVYWKTCEFGSDYILTIWSLEIGLNSDQNKVYLIIYSIISILGIVFIFSRTFVIVNGIIKYNKKMHDKLVVKLMQAPINLFHDIVPRGQIMNRLSKDLDNSIKFFWVFNASFRLFFQLLSCIIICIFFNWYSLLMFPIMFSIQFLICRFYIRGGKELNRLESSVRSPILSGFSETLNGVSTIRGYEFQENFRKKYHNKLDDFYKILVYQNGCANWFAMNLDLISFLLLFFILSFAVLFKEKLSPEAMGLLLTYTLKLIDHTYIFFEQFTLTERFLTSIERCDTFTHIVQEKSFIMKKDEYYRKNHFPHEGRLTFVNYSVRYRPDANVVLKNLNFEIQPTEKIGVVGRTGSGKSTLCLCAFRILEPYIGKILIDDVDITTLGLKFLREILTVIPQDPILIEGTLRENLDPTHKFSEEEILKELNEIGLGYMIKNHGLAFPIKEGGQNLSVGERQLICITRAILRKSKIVIMDEATSSIDYKTELLIQNSINLSLKYSTVITIAHRIKTIINYDRIFVLKEGELVESGKPDELIKSGKGIFYELYLQSNI